MLCLILMVNSLNLTKHALRRQYYMYSKIVFVLQERIMLYL